MNEKIDVSIVIINYNSFNLLTQCLDSLIKFTKDVSYEIIVVDNNSTEGSIEETLAKYDDIKLIKNSENVGFAKANNQGFEIAQGKFILLLNNDTQFTENSIRETIKFAETLSGNFIISCKLINEDYSFQNSAFKFPTLMRQIMATFFIDRMLNGRDYINKNYLMLSCEKKARIVDSVIGAFMLIPKYTYHLLNGFDEKFFFYHEDTDLCYRLHKLDGKVFYYPGTSIVHYGGATAEKKVWFTMKNKMISRIQFAQKHFSFIERHLYILVEYMGAFIRSPIFLIFGVFSVNKSLIKKSFYSFKLLFVHSRNNFVRGGI